VTRVAVVAYGVNNLESVMHAFRHLGVEATAAASPDELNGASHVVLPGVGGFPAGMAALREMGFADALPRVVKAGTPLLGLCLGMQLLADGSDEFGRVEGLGLLPGRVEKLDPGELPLPHMGWNEARLVRSSPLFDGLGPSPDFYFVHSYALSSAAAQDVVAECSYGGPVTAAVARGNIYGVQFHPEKSHKAGLALLRNFVTLC
jgi:imidazole glycerol-phosphate synthase subunit HisH